MTNLCLEEIVKQRPVLTEAEMSNLCTYDEIVDDALRVFDEKVNRIIQQNDYTNSDQEQ